MTAPDQLANRNIISLRHSGRPHMDLIHSDKKFDWLGPGAYFWESDPHRALEWAKWKAARGEYKDPFVIGAAIDLGNCLDLTGRETIDLLRWAYNAFAEVRKKSGLTMPKNVDAAVDQQHDKLLRYLDCAVITHLHNILDDQPDEGHPDIGVYVEPFDTVRGLFPEGDPIYPGSGFREKTHSQIAVRNNECIKGIFLPR